MKSDVPGRWLARCIPPLTRHQLGVVRLLLAAALAYIVFDQRLPAEPFPRELHVTTHVLADWDWVHALAANTARVAQLEWLCLLLVGIFALGILSRVTFAAIVIALTVWTLVRLTHTGVHPWAVMLVTLWGLLPVRWGDGVSIDALIRRGAWHDDGPRASYGFALWLPGLVLGTAMLGAGVAKLVQSGIAWMTNGTVKYYFVTDALYAPTEWGLWVASHHWAAVALSIGAIATECSMIAAVFLRSYLARLPFALAGFGLLAGFFAFQNELWPAWWALYLLFFIPWPHILPRGGTAPRAANAEPLSPLFVAVALIVCGLQTYATVTRTEISPLFSDYPMYSKTYDSIAAFEDATGVPPTYGFSVTFADGVEENASQVFERLELDGPVRDAYIAVKDQRPEAGSAPNVVAAAARALTSHYGRPLKAITVLIDQRGFNWETGRFEWRAVKKPVHTFEVK